MGEKSVSGDPTKIFYDERKNYSPLKQYKIIQFLCGERAALPL